MGYKEAIEDGIRIVSGYNYTAYYPRCHICGEEMKVMAYIRNAEYTCKQCKLKEYLADKEIKNEYSKEAKEKKCSGGIDISRLILDMVKLNGGYCKVFLARLKSNARRSIIAEW